MTIPRTSPIAQPVRQCTVAEKATRLSDCAAYPPWPWRSSCVSSIADEGIAGDGSGVPDGVAGAEAHRAAERQEQHEEREHDRAGEREHDVPQREGGRDL